MIREDTIIKEKINYFYGGQCKVHITKVPNAKFPKGKFHNGIITTIYDDKILFLDDVDDATEIFFSEIADIDKFKERENET